MTRTKIAATLMILAAGVLGVYLPSALAVQADNWIYYGNQLIEVDFDDGSSIQYGYDENGNRITKTFGNGSPFYTISASAGPGGAISPPGPESVISGGDCTFTVMPNPGYYVSNVVVDGNSVGAVTGYTFTNVTASHSISVSFINTLPITVSVNGSGAISPASAAVAYGGSQTFTISPATGWYIANVVVDGSPVGTPLPTSYTFTNVMEPHSIAVDFAIYTYSITTSAIGSGSLTPTSATVDFGGSQTFAITPVPGTYIVSVQVDGVPQQGTPASYTFTNVSSNHVLSATFSLNGPVKIVRTNLCYQHLQDAYNAAQTGDTILVQNVDLTENFTANSSISVTIDGGYTSDFSSNPGTTTITGAATINSGTVTMENCAIN